MRHLLATFGVLFVIGLGISPALADESAEVTKMLRLGQTEAAAARLEVALAAKPRDAQLRFLRGVIQIEQKKTDEAIATFQRMTEDFPELPEPYNNLAVLHAGKGQYDKARAALELAIRTHPSYATAQENLGDVYAKLASESYNKALQLDANNSATQVKLGLIKELIGSKTVKPSLADPAVAKPTAVAAIASTATAAAVASKKPTLTPALKPEPAPLPAPAAVNMAPVLPKALPLVAPSSPIGKGSADSSEAEILAVTQTWANAWSAKKVDLYLAQYSPSFRANDGGSRKIWAAERRERIERKRVIKVVVENPVVSLKDDKASVTFRQGYEADSFKTSTVKTLVFSKANGSWLIVAERTGK